MKIIINGAHGFLGQALHNLLYKNNVAVVRLVRELETQPSDHIWNPYLNIFPENSVLEGADAWISLSGQSIAKGRWSEAKRQQIIESRTVPLQSILRKIQQLQSPPKALLAATGIGIYAENWEQPFDETGPLGSGFLAQVAQNIESILFASANTATSLASLRIAPIFDPSGGMLQKLLPLFKLGLGGPIGAPGQFHSWISLQDAAAAIFFAAQQQAEGPINIAAPRPVLGENLGLLLGKTLHRPCWLRLPQIMSSLLLGRDKAKELLYTSHNIFPKKLQTLGFEWRHPDLECYLKTLE